MSHINNIYGNHRTNRRRTLYKFDLTYCRTLCEWNPALLLLKCLWWQVELWGSCAYLQWHGQVFLIYHMSLVPGYREIVMQSLTQISALDDLDRLGNPSHQGLVSPCDFPGLEEYVDLLLSSDTSHTEVVVFIYCFYPIFLNDSIILSTLNELLGNSILKISQNQFSSVFYLNLFHSLCCRKKYNELSAWLALILTL